MVNSNLILRHVSHTRSLNEALQLLQRPIGKHAAIAKAATGLLSLKFAKRSCTDAVSAAAVAFLVRPLQRCHRAKSFCRFNPLQGRISGRS
jgi:hypothetical protein